MPASHHCQPVFILGSTGVGKTDLALKIARQLPCEIISVDSTMVYRDMKIGTAVPTPEQCGAVPYHLVNFVDPARCYSVGEFCTDAVRLIRQVQGRKKLPLLVGGTMFYFHALEYGIDRMPTSNEEIRKRIEVLAVQHGIDKLYRVLLSKDPETAATLHPNDSQRIKRALEVYFQCGIPISRFKGQGRKGYETVAPKLKISLEFSDRDVKHDALCTRFEQMLQSGLIDEVCRLLLRGDLTRATPAIRAVGYRQVWKHLCGEYSRKTMHEKAVTATMQLAKRQMLWVKKMTRLSRISVSGTADHTADVLALIRSANTR